MNDYRDIIIEDLSETIDGLKRVIPTINYDNRGSTHTDWSKETHDSLLNKHEDNNGFVEEKILISKPNVIRGFHCDFKTNKLISVISGNVVIVVVDIRKHCKTYLSKCIYSSKDNTEKVQLFVPFGCAIAYITLDSESVYSYKLSHIDEGVDSQLSFIWNDPTFNIDWDDLIATYKNEDNKKENTLFTPILSERDKNAPEYNNYISKLP